MKLRKITLFKEITPEVKEIYSKHKLGDVEVTNILADQMSVLISNNIKITSDKYALYTTNKYPLNESCKKNSLILSENVSKKLKIPFFVGEYSYKYDMNNFYDDYKQRHDRIFNPFLKDKENIKSKNYSFIMIDDSTFTGMTLKASILELKQVTDTVDFFTLMDLSLLEESEEDINNYTYNKGGINLLSEIIVNDKYVYTSHMIRTIEKLSKENNDALIKLIGQKKASLLEKARMAYFDEKVI